MKNKIYLILGLIFLFNALGLTLYNTYMDKRAERWAKELVMELNLDQPDQDKKPSLPPREEEAEIPTKNIGGRDFIGVLKIERLDKELPIASSFDYDTIRTYPARYRGKTYEEPLIILAHNYGSQFGDLAKLQEGDRISLTDVLDRTIDYEVVELEIINGEDIDSMVKTDYDLTLFTCTLEGSQRITIRAKKLQE